MPSASRPNARGRRSLGTLLLATLLADFLAFALMIAGVEGFRVVSPGASSLNEALAADLHISHSFLVVCVLAALAAAAAAARGRDRRAIAIVFVAVVSHWPLDVISHPPDMALAPGAHTVFGLGLWRSRPLTLIVEGAPWALAVILYARATRSTHLAGTLAFWGVAAFLTLAWFGNISGSSLPPTPKAMGISSGIFFTLVVAWAYWMNRQRVPAGVT